MHPARWLLVGSVIGLAGRVAAQGCEMPDALEPNDTCVTAPALGAGAVPGLTVQGAAATAGADPDCYRITVAPGEMLQVDAFFSTASGDVDLELFSDVTCTQLLDASYTLTDDEHVQYVHSGVAPVDLILRVVGFGPGFDCNDYDLLVVIAPNPCLSLGPDASEEDDDCASAGPLYGGLTTGLNVSKLDSDWFHLTLDPGASLSLELRFLHAQGDLDLRLWDVCPTLGATPFSSSESETDDEWLGFGNASALPVDLWVEVYVWSGSSSDCNDYEWFVTLEGGVPATALCFGDGTDGLGCPCGNLGGSGEGCANSTGSGAVLSASGTNVHANDDLVLHVAGARANQPGMTLQGGSQIQVSFRDGVLCVGSPTERLELLMLDAAGAAQTTVSIVTAGAIPGPATTRYYQFWFRDPALSVCGQGSNLTQALRVDWN